MNIRTTFLQIFLIFCMTEWTRTEVLQVGHSFNEVQENDINALFDVIRRVENIESTNNYITKENRRLRDDVTALKKHISTMKMDHESIVADLQIQISELRSDLSDEKKADPQADEKVTDQNSLDEDVSRTPDRGTSKQGIPVDDIQTMANEKRRELSVTKSEESVVLRSENEVNVAFYASVGQHHIEHAGANQNIVFDDVITNLGNAYNKFAGDFRAPVAGTYVFSVTLMAYGAHTTHYRIVKNGTSVGLIYLRGQDGAFETSAVTAVLDLQKGDDVSIQNIDADEYLHGYSYSMFSGFLLQQNFASQAIVGK